MRPSSECLLRNRKSSKNSEFRAHVERVRELQEDGDEDFDNDGIINDLDYDDDNDGE